jgi:hypothetical protein
VKRVAIIDKAPSRNNYSTYFSFEFEQFHMSEVPITKQLKSTLKLPVLLVMLGSWWMVSLFALQILQC